jgi:hypothetical protein
VARVCRMGVVDMVARVSQEGLSPFVWLGMTGGSNREKSFGADRKAVANVVG